MSSGSKKTTVGYWYRLLYHFGLVKGPVDAFLEFRAGDRTAWKGELTQSGRISVNAANLWGGEKSEGGVEGEMDIMMGEPTQLPNSYLATHLGADQPSYRGKVSALWRGGRWGAMNPYPKGAAFNVRRVLKGWDGDKPWYPERAEIQMLDGRIELLGAGWEYKLEVFSEPNTLWDNFVVPTDGWVMGGEMPFTTNGMAGGEYWRPTRSNIWLRRRVRVNAAGMTMNIAADNGCVVWIDGVNVGSSNPTNAPIADNHFNPVSYSLGTTGTVEVVIKAFAEIRSADEAGNLVTLDFVGLPLIGMNPAHILYDSLTAQDMQGEPVAMVNDASFRAAADTLYWEGFGLCMEYRGEPLDEFQQRICDIIGGSLTQSRIDGEYYLDLIRGDYDVAALPVIGEDEIVDFSYEPSVLTEQPNQIIVEWFDPQKKAERTTAPIQALGAIQAAGRVVPETRSYPEIPTERLALRVAGRDLQAVSTPTARFKLSLNRRPFDLRPGRPFRLQYPAEGVGDLVCVLGDIDTGTMVDGRITVMAVQDVYGFPQAVYVDVEAGLVETPSETPVSSPHQLLIEAPFIELVANMSRTELASLPADYGVLMTLATRARNGLNYSIFSAAQGEEYTGAGYGEWCPTARIIESASYEETAFTISEGMDLRDVQVGTWALWDEEIVRVDALSIDESSIALGRACADTVPALHAAGSRIYFCGDWAGNDGREYVGGDSVRAKLLTRTSTAVQDLTTAVEHTVEMAQRQARPYPPAALRINGAAYPGDSPAGGPLLITWAHRDRQMQADKLIDNTVASVGPEPGTAYTVRGFINGELDYEQSGIGGTEASWTPSGPGQARLEVWSVREGLDSWQKQVREFLIGSVSEFDSLVFSHTPAGYWKLNEMAGALAADISGNSRHGSYVGSPGFGGPGLFGVAARSIHLDANSYVSLPNSALVSGAAARTVGLFVSIDDITLGVRFLFSWGSAASGGGWSGEIGRNGNGSFGINMHSTGWLFSSPAGLFSSGQPLFLVAVYTGSRVQCYVNGVQVIDTSRASAATTAAAGAIGRRLYSTELPCVGRYSNVFILPKALSAAEVIELWEAASP